MSSPRRSPRASSGNRLASKRQRVDELQKLIAAEQVAVQGASSKTRELNDARRILEAANQYSRLTTVLDAVTGLPDGQGEQLLTDHADADRSRKSRLTQLEGELSAALERQHRLRARLDQLRARLPPADQARQQLRRAQNDTAVQRWVRRGGADGRHISVRSA
ncbi:hypothetical protein FJT64_013546 [Amphibalanus amphitrite]|uniref:Uncharacterized protein n=1 Tax=Amphibalanus amphitrite TaxID=1232801 RepID=A0A6A4VEP4_AMPAM|nr:hypothetical protein FJT64_013546 [Amphibalanus amphitrite]KAF0288051.1 hypothetical protein FJT64_013546 [Amphibalanus amphitrite]